MEMMHARMACSSSPSSLCINKPVGRRPTVLAGKRYATKTTVVIAGCRPYDDDQQSQDAHGWFRIRPEPPEWVPDRGTFLHSPHLNTTSTATQKKTKKTEVTRVEQEMGSSSSSVSMALSSMVSIIRELKSHAVALQVGEGKVPPLDDPELQVILARVHEEIDASFYCIFRHVFSRTPSLMLSLLLLLSDFAASKSFRLSSCSVSPDVDTVGFKRIARNPTLERGTGAGSSSGSGSRGGFVKGQEPEIVVALEEEARLWKGIMDEATRLKAEMRHPALMDHETVLSFVSPVTVEVEPDFGYPEFLHTDITYQVAVSREPDNPMILSNYAQFLIQVVHDLERAEHYFKRAAEIKPGDAEALSRYARFLWMEKEDLSMAEEMYLQAIDADPHNPTHHSNYAHFLWRTGAEDTCYPLDDLGMLEE